MRGTNNAMVLSSNILMARHELEHQAVSNIVSGRGAICVERHFKGRTVWIPIFRQNMYKEWNGCFSIL